MAIVIKNADQIEKMRAAGKVVKECFDLLETLIKPGVTTLELDAEVEKLIRAKGGIPSFKGYRGFPASICASPNDEVIHGIPNKKKLTEGDIISIDIGVCLDGYHGDAARTFGVGVISDEAQNLIDVTKQSFFEGMKLANTNHFLNDVSTAIQKYVEQNDMSVVVDFVGHGIGQNLHEAPEIPNFRQMRKGPKLQVGMTLAIEPMVNLGSRDVVVLDDGWTVKTADGKLTAHYENTVLITDGDQPEILTL